MSLDNCNCLPNPITVPSGEDGAEAFVYIAYADDSGGNGFSTTDESKPYISIISTTEEKTNNSTLHSGNWSKWHGDDGASSSSEAKVLYNDHNQVTTTNSSYTTLKSTTVPSGTVSNNGDILRITAALAHKESTFKVNSLPAVTFHIYDKNTASEIYSGKISFMFANGIVFTSGSETNITFQIDLYRISNTSGAAITDVKESKGSTFEVKSHRNFYDTALNSSIDFSKDTNIELKVRSDGSGTVKAESLTVEYINNP